MCTCIIFVFFALLEYVVVLCLIHHCDPKSKRKGQKERAEQAGDLAGATFVDNNGIRVTNFNKKIEDATTTADQLTQEQELVTQAKCQISHIIQQPQPSPQIVTVKRSNIFACCNFRKSKMRKSSASCDNAKVFNC